MKRILIIVILLAACRSLFAQEWTVTIDNGRIWDLRDDLAVDGGESVLGIGYADDDGYLVKIDKSGEYVDRIVHLPGMMLCYYSAVQLDDGGFMAFGVCDDSLCNPEFQRYIRVDVFDDMLEVVTSRTYAVADGTFECFSAADYGRGMLKAIPSPRGTVFLIAAPAYYVEGSGYYKRALQLYELDSEGNILERKSYPTVTAGWIQEITYEPHSDNMLVAVQGGNFQNSQGVPGIYVVNTKLEIVARKDMYDVQGGYGYEVDAIEEITMDGKWIDGNRILLNTIKHHQTKRPTFPYASLYVIDSAMNVYGEVRLPPYDSLMSLPQGTSTAYINDTTVFALTYCRRTMVSVNHQANVILLDGCLNILGRKAYSHQELAYLPGSPVAFSDGGCLVPMSKSRLGGGDSQFQGMLMKFRREDIEITWDVVQENTATSLLSPYPNPTTGILNIPIGETNCQDARLQIFDMKGGIWLDSALDKQGNLITVDTQNLEAGLYVYKLLDGNREVANGKFVKE